MIHTLKALPEFFKETEAGTKTLETRKNDRFFKKGDYVALNEWDGEAYTGKCTLYRIDYILDDPRYCKEGFVTLAIKPCRHRKQRRQYTVGTARRWKNESDTSNNKSKRK